MSGACVPRERQPSEDGGPGPCFRDASLRPRWQHRWGAVWGAPGPPGLQRNRQDSPSGTDEHLLFARH